MKYTSQSNADRKHPVEVVAVFPMRINKYLAFKKHSTRRGADELIVKKLVFINNRLAVLGDKVTESDVVDVRFRQKPTPHTYFAYHKPKGIVTGSESAEHSAVDHRKNLAHTSTNTSTPKNIFPIGGLEKESSGLIILTTDGRLTDKLLSPLYPYEREYAVKTKNILRISFKEKIEAGVRIEDGTTKPCKVTLQNETAFRVVLTEERHHQIRRMCSALFQEVASLQHIRILNISLGTLKEGGERKIEGTELELFLKTLGL